MSIILLFLCTVASEVSSNLSLSPVGNRFQHFLSHYLFPACASILSLEHYHRHRLEVGIAEGPDEIPVGSCFPLEYNLDFCNGSESGMVVSISLTERHTLLVRECLVTLVQIMRQALLLMYHSPSFALIR